MLSWASRTCERCFASRANCREAPNLNSDTCCCPSSSVSASLRFAFVKRDSLLDLTVADRSAAPLPDTLRSVVVRAHLTESGRCAPWLQRAELALSVRATHKRLLRGQLRTFTSVRLRAAAARPPPYARACPWRAWLAAAYVSLHCALDCTSPRLSWRAHPTPALPGAAERLERPSQRLPPSLQCSCCPGELLRRRRIDRIYAPRRSRPALSRPRLSAFRLPRSVQRALPRCAVCHASSDLSACRSCPPAAPSASSLLQCV
jgi:hypothetical protein